MREKFFSVQAPPLVLDELGDLIKKPDFLINPEIQQALKKANEHYYHWDELKYKDWIPKEIFPIKEHFWTLLKIERTYRSRLTPIKDSGGNYFRVNNDRYAEFLHIIDKEMAGNFMGIKDFSEGDKKQFVARNLIEESIASSQLEGANTSRAVAKKMLLEGRKPQNHGEKMIRNNHITMEKIEQTLYKEKLSWGLICELHRMITFETIPENKQGVLRETLAEHGNRLVIKPWDNETIAYVAPDKEFVEIELPRLIDFANNENIGESYFIHPLIKAILLHFWVGLLHPFEDGNGRLARILFYWYILKSEYWAFAYLSLSEKILKSSKQYAMAYIYSEQDYNDLNYFVNYNIEKIMLARRDFQNYIKKAVSENISTISLVQQKYDFNERQIKLLQHLNQKTQSRTNIVAHQRLYSVKKGTAINDLKVLVDKGFLVKQKQGRNIYYYPTNKVYDVLK